MNGHSGNETTRGASRRERLREQLVRDAKAAARELTASEGIAGLTLAAVARRVGVSSPALYRYFNGKQGLVRAIYDDLTGELISTIEEAVGRQDADDISAKLHAATRAVLTWSVANRAGFSLLMGASYPAAAASQAEITQVIPRKLGALFGGLFADLWQSGRLKFRQDEEIAPDLLRQLDTYRQTIRPDLPLGVTHLMITCWRQIYGMVNMAVYGHLAFAFEDHEALFEDMMEYLLALLGLEPSSRLR